ncbi:MAG: hypothetical protein ABIO72_04405 [Patescibacteria group bacterium]
MKISREEITTVLMARGQDKTIVEPAMESIEPFLAHIDAGFPLSKPPNDSDIQNAICAVTQEPTADPHLIRHNFNNGNIKYIDPRYRGQLFSEVVRAACHVKRRRLVTVPTDSFSPSLRTVVSRNFANPDWQQLHVVYRHTPESVKAVMEHTRETILAVLECYFNLTVYAEGPTLRTRLKPLLRFIAHTIPLAQVNNAKLGTWTVLV